MADISAIKALDGVTYSIKDLEARDHLVPSSGTTGQVLTKTANGYGWVDPSGGGTVDTVNGISPDTNKNVQVDVELTQAEYDALPSSKLTDDVNYWITDGENNPLNNTVMASGVAYDNTDSGLTATNAQDAVDELASNMRDAEIDISSEVTISTAGSLSAVLGIWYSPKTGRVHGYFAGNATSSYNQTSAFMQISSTYAPRSVVPCGGVVNLSATSSVASKYITIDTTGALLQAHTGGCMGIFAVFEYYI